eukprot:848366-Pelagomonas_calceolata.AAC.1
MGAFTHLSTCLNLRSMNDSGHCMLELIPDTLSTMPLIQCQAQSCNRALTDSRRMRDSKNAWPSWPFSWALQAHPGGGIAFNC